MNFMYQVFKMFHAKGTPESNSCKKHFLQVFIDNSKNIKYFHIVFILFYRSFQELGVKRGWHDLKWAKSEIKTEGWRAAAPDGTMPRYATEALPSVHPTRAEFESKTSISSYVTTLQNDFAGGHSKFERFRKIIKQCSKYSL